MGYDCVILGGGPAGLSAALVLGRCRRTVAVLDSGRPRNQGVASSHGFFTQDGASPEELRRIGRAQLAPYDTVRLFDDEALEVASDGEAGFTVRVRNGAPVRARKVLLATGMRDRVPEIPGFRELWGKSVHVCPYCDGWELREKRLCAYAPAETGPDFALGLLTWTKDVMLVTAGERVADEERARLLRHGIVIHEETIASLEGTEGKLRALVLGSGRRIERDAVFVHFGSEQVAPFARQLGCTLGANGAVVCREGERAGVPGVFVAGDASHDLQLIAVAVAEGVKAACAINTELRREDRP
ncbi:MAG: hypothetical protein JWP97_684 [Labilithrix sp.]|nr:hypothetical protein [Labilithrix sp.]